MLQNLIYSKKKLKFELKYNFKNINYESFRII